jgi:hypothetical protein
MWCSPVEQRGSGSLAAEFRYPLSAREMARYRHGTNSPYVLTSLWFLVLSDQVPSVQENIRKYAALLGA